MEVNKELNNSELLSYKPAEKFIVDEIASMKGYDVLHINVKGYSPITDDFIICTVDSDTQLRSLSNAVERRLLKEIGIKPLNNGKEQALNSGWVVLDYFDFMIHLFLPREREYYSLERLWNMCETNELETNPTAE